ncbi:MAG: acetylxylan esterase, partial [Alistipes sp.]|nr:acetylxylan esterase [Candidatus Minthomonas equi]
MNKTKIIILLCVLVAVPAFAQNSYDGHTEKMFSSAHPKYTLSFLDEMGLDKWQASFRSELRSKLGISVIEASVQEMNFKPSATFLRSEDDGTMIREWWEMTTEPDVVMKFIVMKPKNQDGSRLPLMIATHGHSKSTEISAGIYRNEDERASGEDGERNIGVQAVQHGFIAIAPAMRGFGDTRHPDDIERDSHSSCLDLYQRDVLVGRTPVGDRVWDMMKLIDWAFENLPVDTRNVVISGNSGGGTVSIYAAAVEPRITMSVPGSAFCTFERSIGFMRHCACNY